MKQALIILTLLFSVFCCKINHLKKTQKLISSTNFQEKILQTKNFKIFTLQKITDISKPIRIYIEGDGKAFIGKNKISPDPTPQSDFLISLAIKDNSPNVIYMARPCQFIDDKKCAEKYWTSARFSQEVINSFDEIIKNFNQKIELIGYSGGAMIALFIASKNNNVINIKTIAGNLDHEEFTKIHEVPALNKSLKNKNLNFRKLAKIPQTHLIGDDDKIVPVEILNSYLRRLPNKSLVEVIKVNRAGHSSDLYQEQFFRH